MLILDDLIKPIRENIDLNELLTQEKLKHLDTVKSNGEIYYGTFGTFRLEEVKDKCPYTK